MATAISDEQIASICRSEIDSSSGYAGGEISNERAEALNYYYGEPYGDEVEGRSQVVTREVMETVEWILPSLARIFTDAENLVEFTPTNPDDVSQAKLETKVSNYVYWKQNRGFYNTYTFLKDALLSKTGILKIYWDDADKESKEKYENLTPMQVEAMQMDPNTEREVLELEELENGLVNVTFKTIERNGQIRIEPVPPEEFGIARYARTPYTEDVNFCYHRTQKTFSELVQMGYSPDVIRTLPFDDDVQTEEELARRNMSDEQEPYDYVSEESMRMYWISECYINVDRDGDNIAELLRVTLAGGHYTASSARLLGIEEVDIMPFATCSPILMPHKFYGLSIADLTMDLQRIKSVLLRQMLDNTYLANNTRTAVNDTHVNMDDLLTSRPGGVVRYKGEGAASQYITPIPHNALPAQAFNMMEYIDDTRKQRTGVGDEVAGLDKNSLSSINPGVAAMAYDAARMKIELIARILAEVGFKSVFKIIHKLLLTHQDIPMMVNVGNQFAMVNPADWKDRENTSVTVGTGTVSKEKKMIALETIMNKQQEIVKNGGLGTIVMPHQLYQTVADMADAFGLPSDQYFTDPRTVPPKPPQPDVQQELAIAHSKALAMDAQSKLLQVQVTSAKNEAEASLKLREQELTAQSDRIKHNIELEKMRLEQMQAETQSEEKIASLGIQIDKNETEERIKEMQLALQENTETQKREVEIFKAKIDSLTKLLQTEAKISDNQQNRDMNMLKDQLQKDVSDGET